ncbi:9.3K protein [Maguari virus]|uniref:9.3K protein n=1 Tax=Maguari virus TaxID=11575 RepID=A0A291NVX4_MAGV|nr:9.3K protein [Maguari virus]ATJ04181.1 9.3K protein [Maguari virus]
MVRRYTSHSFQAQKCSWEHSNSTHWLSEFTRFRGRKWNLNIWRKQCDRGTWVLKQLHGQLAKSMKSRLHLQLSLD